MVSNKHVFVGALFRTFRLAQQARCGAGHVIRKALPVTGQIIHDVPNLTAQQMRNFRNPPTGFPLAWINCARWD
jgi:hypothetical protein